MPDLSGEPPRLVEQCGYHSEQHKQLTNLREERDQLRLQVEELHDRLGAPERQGVLRPS